ncbi:MAG: ABC transporter permease [Methanomassiliicoccus sp.]|nr:ABC transporter permease [Methanomassiliicoccus sp.]
MKSLTNIMLKEIKELLTVTTIIPVVIMAVLFASLGGMIGGVQDEASQAPRIGLIVQDLDSSWSMLAQGTINNHTEVVYGGTDIDEGLKAVSSAGGTALLVIPEDFGDNISSERPGTIAVYWIMYGAGLMDSISSSVVDGIIVQVNTDISRVMIEEGSSSNASMVLSPTIKSETTFFKEKSIEGVSPSAISSMLSSQSFIIPLVVMMMILMSGSTVISSMGLEKENKTLETLLTMPVRRSHIVLGKLGGAAVVGLLMAFIYMAGMGYYMNGMQGSAAIDVARYGLVLETMDYVLVGISLFLSVLGGLALCMILGALARDYKAAQSLTLPITFLAMLPFFALMMKDFNTLPALLQAVLFAIPFTHPMMAMNNLMFDDYGLVIAGIAYQLLFAAIAVAAAVWLFKKDMLITGRRKRGGSPFGKGSKR